MKASELRLGNIIKDDRKVNPWRFVTHRIISDLASNPNIELYHPINITEEWLITLGFKKHETYDFGISLTKVPLYVIIDDTDVSVVLSSGKYWYATRQYDGGTSDPYEPVIEVETIHQLQNLYFALTAKELEINNGTNFGGTIVNGL